MIKKRGCLQAINLSCAFPLKVNKIITGGILKNNLIVLIALLPICFHVNAAENYFTKRYHIENKKKPYFSHKIYTTKIPFILVKGRHNQCNDDYFSKDFDCLAHPESTHFIKIATSTGIINYEDKKALPEAVNYTVYKEFRLVHKDFWSKLFNSPRPQVLLKAQDGKVIEVDVITFNYYIAKDNKYRVQDDMKSRY